MGYWWKNPLTRMSMKGKTILKFTGEGSQGRNEFDWAGKIIGFERSSNDKWDNIVIHIIIHNLSYGDARDNDNPEVFKYPLVNSDIQNVNGVWVLFGN